MVRSVVGRILGVVFLFSGFVKCADPVGTSVFVEKYLATYSLDSLLFAALPIAVLLASVELTLGVMLLLDRAQRPTAILTTLFMAVFTIITLLSATVLPIGHCGCFGDAVKLSPWETLAKNLVMLPMAAYIWWGSAHYVYKRNDLIICILALVAALGINLYSLRYQPILDAMPYRVGVNLHDEIRRERQAVEEARSTHLVFRTAEGEELLFSADDTECWLRDDLEFVESRSEAPASVPQPFAEFIVTSAQGEECTLDLLAENSDVLLLTIYDVDALSGRRLKAVRELLDGQQRVAVLTSAEASAITEILGVEPFMLDAMTLRSLIRSRVGVVEINAGVIVRKCDVRDL